MILPSGKTATTRTTQPLLSATALSLTSRRRSSAGGGILLGHAKPAFRPIALRHPLVLQARTRTLAMSSFLKNLLGTNNNNSDDSGNNGKMASSSLSSSSSSSSSSFPVQKTDQEWRAVLSPGEFSVCMYTHTWLFFFFFPVSHCSCPFLFFKVVLVWETR